MGIQIIITGNDAAEVRNAMSGFFVNGSVGGDPVVGEAQANGAAAAPKRVGRPKKEAAPEPQQEEPTGEAEVDNADEAAQAEAEKQTRALTVDDVRAEMNEYVKKYGLENCQIDVAWVFNKRFGDKVNKATDIPPAMFATIVQDIRDMTAKNPFKREALN